MKKLVIVLAVACSAAAAQRLTHAFDTADGTWYLADYSQHGSVQRVWMVLDRRVRDTDGALSEKVMYELNCRDLTVRSTFYSYPERQATGKLIGVEREPDWKPIVPGTMPRSLQQLYCR